jgi:hypothetical protein
MLNQLTSSLSAGAFTGVKFLLHLMRMGHSILGITPPRPEHERAFLMMWIAALFVVFLISAALVLFLVPRIMG